MRRRRRGGGQPPSPSRGGRPHQDLHLVPLAHRGVEAAPPVRMAGRPRLPHEHQKAVPVAIDAQLDELLHMPRSPALHPERPPRPAPVGHPARLERGADRRLAHPGHHQHLARALVLRDRGDKAVRIVPEARRIEGHRSPFPHARGPPIYGSGDRRESHGRQRSHQALLGPHPRTRGRHPPDRSASRPGRHRAEALAALRLDRLGRGDDARRKGRGLLPDGARLRARPGGGLGRGPRHPRLHRGAGRPRPRPARRDADRRTARCPTPPSASSASCCPRASSATATPRSCSASTRRSRRSRRRANPPARKPLLHRRRSSTGAMEGPA
jgi:hypothetical protein